MCVCVYLAPQVNHYVDGNVAYRRYDAGSRCVVLEALVEIPAGVEVRMNYGPLQSWETLMQYGFVDPYAHRCVCGCRGCIQPGVQRAFSEVLK